MHDTLSNGPAKSAGTRATGRRPARMAALALVPLTALALAGCGSEADPKPEAPVAAAPTPTTQPAAPSETPTLEPSFGPVKKTTVFDIATKDGYKATMTIRWHARRTVPRDTLFEGCEASLSSQGSSGTAEKVYYAATAEIGVEFQTTGGFTWPADQSINVTFGDGKETQTWDRATTCYEGQDLDSPAALRQFPLSPQSSSTTVMWVETAERTPKNPNGTIKTDPDSYEISPQTDLNGTCTEKGKKPDSARACIATYGD
ncbi:hypothetical protein AGRA3207_003056 [Actinomadura graeca]|uniref:Lipoprotein n=1 Tax=Actinomadura graeca TaxID=2750812 RepID=A0ABX8QTG9_9ACTN|nr:hypothetical protein [Actinomadura graeca]QXJ22109.1 hypothetical protein AGRA3207_003056 [Actinomadura graeca]